MKKNSEEIFSTVEIDPISGQFYLTIPEEVVNELSWYEDATIKFTVEGSEVILSEEE